MIDIPDNGNAVDPVFIRTQLDEILAGEIVSFIKIDSDSALLSYNLATIACLVIAVEREREINDAIDSPPERFTRKTFMEELVDIGLEKDDKLTGSVDSVIDMGYLTIDSHGKLKAEVSAYTTVALLDTIFPGMPGMNLVAFVMQMNDEVVSGRKSLEYAKTSFMQTLKSRGVALTRKKAENIKPDLNVKKPDARFKIMSEKLKKANEKKIAKLRLKKISGKPSFYSRDGYVSSHIKVKSVFDRGGTSEKEIKAAQEAERAAAEQNRKEEEQKAQELAQMKERIKQAEKKAEQAEKKAKELAIREKELEAAKFAAEEAEKKALELKNSEVEKAAAQMEVELRAMEEKLKAAEKECTRREQGTGELLSDVNSEHDKHEEKISPLNDLDDIESRIAVFEAELAMPCPICKKGKVISETTSAGKVYYTCSDKDCRFVSWDKPCHFSCPMCKNPYLVEFDLPSGGKGLKCPRAVCSYTQDNLLDPVQNFVSKVEKSIPRKKKRVVRRVRRRR